jgi:hypothetical protein
VDGVKPRDMLAIAEQTKPVIGTGSTGRVVTTPRNFVLPKRKPAGDSVLITVGAILGLLGLIGVALLALRLFRHAHSVRDLREEAENLYRIRAEVQARRARAPQAQPPSEPERPPPVGTPAP